MPASGDQPRPAAVVARSSMAITRWPSANVIDVTGAGCVLQRRSAPWTVRASRRLTSVSSYTPRGIAAAATVPGSATYRHIRLSERGERRARGQVNTAPRRTEGRREASCGRIGFDAWPTDRIRTARPTDALPAAGRPTDSAGVAASRLRVARPRRVCSAPAHEGCRQGWAKGRSRRCPCAVGRQQVRRSETNTHSGRSHRSAQRTEPVVDGQQRDRQQAHPKRGPRHARRHRHRPSAPQARHESNRRKFTGRISWRPATGPAGRRGVRLVVDDQHLCVARSASRGQ